MRNWMIACLLIIFITPVVAQDRCGQALEPRLELGQQGVVTVDEDFYLNLRVDPGLNGAEIIRLANGEFFDVVAGPECVDGFNWWQVQQFGLSGWIAESTNRDYLVEPRSIDSLPTLAPPPLSEGLTPVLLADNPQTLETAFIQWDWANFLESRESFYAPPDPLPIVLPETFQGEWPEGPFNLADVRFVNDVDLSSAQMALLATNGFVVVPGGLDQFEDAYRFDDAWDPYAGHAYWVTTDAVLHALYVAFDNLLQFLETEDFHLRLETVLTGSYQAAVNQLAEAEETGLEDAAHNAVVYYAVALGLLNPAAYEAVTPAEDIRAEAEPLIAAALAGEGRLEVPLLGDEYVEDFSQYQPRGHYTASPQQANYFRAMMWLGRITFLARDPDTMRTSMLMLRALEQGNQYTEWATISDLLAFLVGPTDNLGPVDYLPIARDHFGPDLSLGPIGDDDILATFQAQIQALPGPRINNVVRPIGTEVDELDEATRGFRLFGQRFTLDSYVMQRLIYPYVGSVGNERQLPAGLDVAAALGSQTAYDILVEQGETGYHNYTENLIELHSTVSQLNGPDWLQNIYGGWLWALQPLWARNPDQYPAFMNSAAWLRRDLQAGLGSWAELKHATLLYTAQPQGWLGGGGERELNTHGWVEPNPLVFSRIAAVSAALSEGLLSRGIGLQGDLTQPPPGTYYTRAALDNLAELSAMLAEMARKEVWGESLTDDEQLFLKYDFGSKLWLTRYYAELPLSEPPTSSAMIADVASNPDAGTVLEVATGQVDLIYVITDSPDGLQLTRGTVYSYYEFVNPIDERLNDDEWRARVAVGDLPVRPNWIREFYAE